MIKRLAMKVIGRRGIYGIVALMILAATYISVCPIQAYASQSVEQSARKAIDAFFKAGLQKDFNAMVSNSIDSHTLSFRRQIFDDQAKNFLGYQIQSVQEVDSTHAIAIVEIREKNLTATMKYPVVFNGTKWLVDIANATANNLPPMTTSSMTTSSSGNPYYRAGTYSGTAGDVRSTTFTGCSSYLVEGYQVAKFNPSSNSASVSYVMSSVEWWGGWPQATQTVNGNYAEIPTLTFNGLDTSKILLLRVMAPNDNPAYVGGTIYFNL